MLKQGLQNQGDGLDCFGMKCMICFKCLNTKCTSQKLVGYAFADSECLDKILEFLSFREFLVSSNHAMPCHKFVYLYRNDKKVSPY